MSVAWLLKKQGINAKIIEGQNQIGGLARSFNWHGIDCDLAPHRLFTNNNTVLKMLLDLVPMSKHQRNSRILVQGKRIQDPINPLELCFKFYKHAPRIVLGFLFKRRLVETSFADMALNQYGVGLYEFFFKPYTEKLLGVPAESISAEWGLQKLRSSGFSQWIKRDSKTYFSTFYYPRSGGYGQIAQKMSLELQGEINLNSKVTGLNYSDSLIDSVVIERNGIRETIECDQLISTLPATILAGMLGQTLELTFNDIQLVYLNVAKKQVMPYHWVYFADTSTVINRMAEFKNFYPEGFVSSSTVLCAEVTANSDNPIEDVISTLSLYGLVNSSDISDAMVVEEKFGYPIYLKDSEGDRKKARELFSRFENLHIVGRNAEFRHIDVDEDIESAIECVETILKGMKNVH